MDHIFPIQYYPVKLTFYYLLGHKQNGRRRKLMMNGPAAAASVVFAGLQKFSRFHGGQQFIIYIVFYRCDE